MSASASYPDHDLPADFIPPALPVALDSWFAIGADRGEDTEVIAYGNDLDGAILDDCGVVDRDTLRNALVGYRWTWEEGSWIDQSDRGEWDANWVVLDSVNADPIIADLSRPEVPVLIARHGEGKWDPQLLAPSLAQFVSQIEMNEDPGPPPFSAQVDEWDVWSLNLGPSPLQTLVAISGHPLFPSYTRAELLKLRTKGPARLADSLSETGARACVAVGERYGATFEARPAAPGR